MTLIYILIGILFMLYSYLLATLTIIVLYIVKNEATWQLQGKVNIDIGAAIKAIGNCVTINNKHLMKLFKGTEQ